MADTPTSGAAPDGIASLTRRLAAGDEEAFREFHTRYFDRLYLFLLAVTRGNEDQAQEALQETFVRVARYVRAFADEEVFWSWLKAVARSAARDAGRKRQRYLSLLRNFALRWQAPDPAPGPDEDRLRLALEEALDGLEALDRRLIEGKYLIGSTVKELADDEGLTDKAVEGRLSRLRRHLREAIVRLMKSE